MTLETKIEKNRIKLEKFLKSFLLQKSKEFKKISPWGKDIQEKLMDFIIKGKMMRGSLVLLSVDKVDSDALKVASAIEILHSAFLIHDDIMDEDIKRRGQDAIHYQYFKELGINFPNAKHYGMSQAISLGDICIFFAFLLVSDLSPVHKEKLQTFFMNEMLRVGFGQMEDMSISFSTKEPTISEIFSVYISKTARYSISVPIVLGMYLNREDDKVIKKALTLGENLGVLFQMKDDELGIFGNQENTGKGVLKDVNKNKKTVLRHLLFQAVNKNEKKELDNIFGNEDLSPEDISRLMSLFEKYDIKNKHQELAETYSQKGEKLIKLLDQKYISIFKFVKEYNDKRVK